MESLRRGAIAAGDDPRAAPRLHRGVVVAGDGISHSQGSGAELVEERRLL